MKNHTEVRVPTIPECDICRHGQGRATPAIVDGKTTLGPWANMCEEHFDTFGLGLGLGIGQRLVLRDAS
jgi:hypothetical protein